MNLRVNLCILKIISPGILATVPRGKLAVWYFLVVMNYSKELELKKKFYIEFNAE